MFWDLSRAGEEQTPEDAQDGPPELYVLMSNIWSVFTNIGLPTDCSCTVVIPTVSPTSVGTLTTLGFFALLRRTTSYRFGRLRMRLLVRIWRTCRPRSWSLDSATTRAFFLFCSGLLQNFHTREANIFIDLVLFISLYFPLYLKTVVARYKQSTNRHFDLLFLSNKKSTVNLANSKASAVEESYKVQPPMTITPAVICPCPVSPQHA